MLETQSIPLPIPQKSFEIAGNMARKHSHPAKAQQVYLNTLAVLVMNDYLQLIEIETDIQQSDCWQPVIQQGADIADLMIMGLGRLECRPVSVAAPRCQVPPEVWEDRLGYVIVQIDEPQKEAVLLGFSPTVGTGELHLNKLQSMDAFLAFLDNLIQPKVNLSQWLVNVFEQGWQELENLVNPPDAAWQFRSGKTRRFVTRNPVVLPPESVARVKLLDVGVRLGETNVAMLVAISPEPLQKFSIVVQLHPAGGDAYLPPHLQLALLSETGETLQQVESRSQDRWIQLRQFRVLLGTEFGLKVSFHDISIVETFTL